MAKQQHKLSAVLDTCRTAITKRYQKRFGVLPVADTQLDLQRWFASDLGQRILSQQKGYLDELLPDLFGYHLMQMSVLPGENLFAESSTSHQFMLQPDSDNYYRWLKQSESAQQELNSQELNQQAKASVLFAEFEQLPIDNDEIDVALLHHALDYSQSPQQLLREVARVTIPNGHIVLVGFNPFSLMGLTQPFACLLSRSAHWRYHQLRISRLSDWFHLLGLELLYCHKGYHGLPSQKYYSAKAEKLTRCLMPGVGSFYVMVVRKNVTPVTLVKKPWRGRKVLPSWKGVAVPSASRPLTNESIMSESIVDIRSSDNKK